MSRPRAWFAWVAVTTASVAVGGGTAKNEQVLEMMIRLVTARSLYARMLVDAVAATRVTSLPRWRHLI